MASNKPAEHVAGSSAAPPAPATEKNEAVKMDSAAKPATAGEEANNAGTGLPTQSADSVAEQFKGSLTSDFSYDAVSQSKSFFG